MVGGDPSTMGPWQLELLVRLGLRKDETLLDLGCGTLRGGLHFSRFLASHRYYGADPHQALLTQGTTLVARAGLGDKAPELRNIRSRKTCSIVKTWLPFIKPLFSMVVFIAKPHRLF